MPRGTWLFVQRATLLVLLHATLAEAGPLQDSLQAPTMPFAEEFDCVNAFDLFASFAALQCTASNEAPHDRLTIRRALARLRQLKLMAVDPAELEIRFCPLLSGTGLVPAPARVLLDDGLRTMSRDGLAEIIAHELVHVQQFELLGSAEFKCAYVRAMSACGGCQDRAHPLEDAAYRAQDRARAALLNSPPNPAAADNQESAK